MAITSALTTKCQTTIPLSVRKHLQIGSGDLIQYELQDGRVVLTPVAKPEEHHEDPFYHFTEWGGANDEEAYADL